MSRETEQKVKKAINMNYTDIIYKLDPGPVIDHLRESGILTVAGHDMYSEELKNMLKVGKVNAAVNERLFEILFTREKWWIPLIKAIRKCDPASEIADIITESLPKSEKLKLESTRSRSGKDRSSGRSSAHNEPIYSRSEASTDGYDSHSDLRSSCNSTRRKLEPYHPNDASNFNPQRNSKEESRHHSGVRHFENFTQARRNLGEQAPVVTNQSDESHMSHNRLFQHSGQPYVAMQTSYSYAGERSLPQEAPGFSRSSSVPAGPPHGQYPQDGQRSSAGPSPGTSHLSQYPQDWQQPSAGYSSQSQNGLIHDTNLMYNGSVTTEMVTTGTFELPQHVSATQGCDGVNVQKNEMTSSLLKNQHIASQDQKPTEDVSSDVKRAEREVTYTMDMHVSSVPCGVLNIFNKLDYHSDTDWREFAGKLTTKFLLDDEHRIDSKSEFKTKQVIDHFRRVEGEKATFGKMISALKEIQRRDLLDEISEITGLELSEEKEIEQTPLGNSRNTKKNTYEEKVDLEFENPGLTPDEGAKMSGACSDKTERVASLSGSATVDNSGSPNVDTSRDSNTNDSKEAVRECKRMQDTDARKSDRPVDDRILMSQLDEERKLDEAIRVESQKQQVTSESCPPRDVQDNHSNHLNISSGSDMSDENNLREGDTIIANQKENLKKPEKTSKIMNVSQPVAGATDMKQTQRTEDDKTRVYYPPGDTGEFGPKIDLPRDSKPVNTGTSMPGGPTPSTQHPGYHQQIPVPVQTLYQHGPYRMTSAQYNCFPRFANQVMNYAPFNQGVCLMPGFPPGQIPIYDPGTVPQQQPQQLIGNIPRLSLIDEQVGAHTQDMTASKIVCSISQPPGNGSKATVWQNPQGTSGNRFSSPSSGNSQPELPPLPDLMANSDGSLYLDRTLGSSVLEGPTAADHRCLQYPALVMPMSFSSEPPPVHNNQANYALQQKINSQNTVEYQLVSSKPREEDDDIPIDEEGSEDEEEEDEDDTEEEEEESEEDTCPKQIDDELQNNPLDETMVKQIIEESQDGIGCKSFTDPAKEDGSPDKTIVKDTMSTRISEGERTSGTTGSEIGKEATNGDKSENDTLSEGGLQARPSEASTSPSEASSSSSDPGGETVAVPSGGRATNSVRNAFKTAVKLYECVSVGTNVNMFQKWHST